MIIRIFAIVFIFLSFVSCNQNETKLISLEQGELITEFIAYDVPIHTDTTGGYPVWLNNITVEGRSTLQEQILNNAREGKFKIYADMEGSEEISWEDFYERSTIRDTVFEIDDESFEETATIYLDEVHASQIVSLRYLEKWSFSSDKSRIQKEIIGFAPLKAVYISDSFSGKDEFIGYQDLFWVRYDK